MSGGELKDLLDEIEAAEKSGLWLLGLAGVLALPDICGAIESDDGEATGRKYKEWFKRYMGAKYPRIDPADCWQLRCSLLHQGRSSAKTYDRLIFVAPDAGTFHNNILHKALNLDMRTFSQDMIAGARMWQTEMIASKNPAYARNVQHVMRWHRGGLPPYVGGIDVLS